MKKVVLSLVAACGLVGSGLAAVYNLKPGMAGHWNEDASWEEGTKPGAGDTVRIGEGVEATAVDADCAWATETGIGCILFAGTKSQPSSLTVTIVSEADLSCSITNSSGSTTKGLIKEGEGRLNLTSRAGSYNLRSRYVVNRGILAFPQGMANSNRNRHFGSVRVNAPGILLIMTGEPGMTDANTYFNYDEALTGDGIVSNPVEQVAIISPQASRTAAPVFTGQICGNIEVSLAKTYGQTFAGTGTSPCTVEMGGTARLVQSSIGGSFGGVKKAGSIGTGNYSLGANNVISYCGLGETTPAKFTARDNPKMDDDMATLTFDGGTNGNLVLAGAVDVTRSRQTSVNLILAGAHPNACTFAAQVNDISTRSPVVNVVKRGAGTWRMNENTNSLVTGTIAVEDGTLAFDTLGDVGANCALGTAEDLGDAAGAVLLGGASTTGRLDYVGTVAGGTMDRPIALVGTGALSSDSAASFSWSGVSAADQNEHTLILNGASTNAKLYNVTNGAGTVSVVKRGSGTWTLGGTLGFTGTIDVKEGSLVLSCATNVYRYFRLNLKERALGITTEAMGEVYNDISRWALFNASGKAQTTNIVYDAEANGHPELLAPGEVALYSRRLNMNYAKVDSGASVGTIFKIGNGSSDKSFWRFYDATFTTSERKVSPWIDRPESWMSVVVRLPTASDPVAYYDIGDRWTNVHKYRRYEYQTWSVDGSLDGRAWTELSSVVSNDVDTLTKQYYWRGKQAAYAAASKEVNTAGWPIASGLIPEETLSRGLAGISVAAGASLTVDTQVTVDKITVEAAGGGAVSGFKLADDGVIDVVGVPAKGAFEVSLDLSQIELPDEVTILVNGQEDRREVTLSADRKSIKGIPPGLIILVK